MEKCAPFYDTEALREQAADVHKAQKRATAKEKYDQTPEKVRKEERAEKYDRAARKIRYEEHGEEE